MSAIETASGGGVSWREPMVRGALLLMETLWIYALLSFFVALTVGGGKPSFIATLVVVAASYSISRALQDSVLSLGLLRIWGAVLSILVFYAVVRVDFYGDLRLWDFGWADALFNNTEATVRAEGTAMVGVPALLVFWIRGILRGQQSLLFEDVLGSFAVGVVVVAGVEFFGSFVDELPRGVELIAVPYVAVGLLAIGLTHAARARNTLGRDFMPAWLLAIGATIGLLGLFALLFVLIDFSTARDGMEAILFGIGWVVAGIFYLVAWPLIKILEGIFWFIEWIANPSLAEDACPFDGSLPANDPSCVPPPLGEDGELDSGASNDLVPAWLLSVTRYVAAGAVVTLLVVGFALLFTRYAKRRVEGDVKESVYTEGRLASDLSGLLGSMFGRFRPRGRGRQAEPVRRLYFEMLAAGEVRGVERLPVETPLDLSPRLQRTFASETPQAITDLFDDVRYGARDPSAEEVQRLREEWDRLKGRQN